MTGSSPISRLWTVLGAALSALPLVLVLVSAALALDLTPGERAEVPGVDIRYVEDPGAAMTLEQALAADQSGETTPIPGDSVDFGLVFGSYWLFVTLANDTGEAGTWYVATRAPFVPDLHIHLQSDGGGLSTLLESSYDTPHADRPIDHRFLVSAPFQLAPGERADLAIQLRTGGVSSLPFTIESAESLRGLLTFDAALTGIFYAFSAAAILFFVLFSVAARQSLGLLHAGLLAMALLLLAQIDGLTFQFLWPAFPVWNAYAALPIWLAICAFGFYVAGVHREMFTPSPRFRRFTIVMTAISLGMIVLVPFAPLGPLAITAYAMLALMLVCQAWGALAMVQQTGGVGRTGMSGAAIMALGVTTMIGLSLAGVQMPPLLVNNAHRIFYLFISLTTMLTFVGFVMRLRRDHEGALEREVAAARRDAELNRELFESEKRYARARDLADTRQRRLAAASHDIKQPLASLRLSLDALVADGDPGVRKGLKEAFDYLEGLTGTYIAEAREGPESERDAPQEEAMPDAPDQSEPYPLSLVTDTVDQMFRDEAAGKGLAFRSRGSGRLITVPVLPLMRLVNNLVANAVKHTADGTISVLSGEAEGHVYLEVTDTGPGMTPEALAEFRQAGRKGEDSAGEGLGLAIADEVTRGLGLTLEIDTEPGRGTRMRILVPPRFVHTDRSASA